MIVALRDAVANTCGGKASALGSLLRAGLAVPDGFVVQFDAYRAAVGGLDLTTSAAVIEDRPLPTDLLDGLCRGLATLGDVPVAVRSSADGEDTVHASAAGQHESVLAVRGLDDVARAMQICWASLHSSRAVSYRSANGDQHPADQPAMAVLIQRLVDAEVSGVMFTPVVDGGVTEIEASWGLGPSVVGGTVTPDSFRVAADGQMTRRTADKQTRIDRDGSHLVTRAVPPDDRDRPTLTDSNAVRLAQLGQEVAAMLGGPQDIEWAITGEHIYVLQTRPITAAAPVTSGTPATASAWLTGTPASHGSATGTARVIRSPSDFTRVRQGDILVCPHTDPAWTPLLSIAAGVITETGGTLSHAAIIAREQRIPAVVGVPDATTAVRDGATLIIDGTTGTVTTP